MMMQRRLLLIAILLAPWSPLVFTRQAPAEDSRPAPVTRFLSDVEGATEVKPAQSNTHTSSNEAPKELSLGAMMLKSADKLRPIRSRAQRHEAADNFDSLQEVQPESAVKQTSDETVLWRPIAQGSESDRRDPSEDQQRESTRSHLAVLRKPIHEIELNTGVDQPDPENRAEIWMGSRETIHISALGFSPPLRNRYTVGFRHRPLYFEQPRLERCGESCGHLQNVMSGARFVADTFLLPYHLCSQHPACLVSAGGDCRTCQTITEGCDLCPLDRKALATQSAAVAGFAFLLL